ncbi:MAG: saccharopine dehydrogenase NADP-binding domain-containing protein [Cyclobacteriaceae bacterium]|nr:saccharopine dehydrogenase NADP-binding domain-containing protein [Cyclobacteriaceae bacterium]
MKKIILFGAGRSSYNLIAYLIDQSSIYNWKITIIDQQFGKSLDKFSNRPNVQFLEGNVLDGQLRGEYMREANLVISMLPAMFHLEIARDCLHYKKPLLTASYISDEMRLLGEEVERNGLLFMNECGLDPGIDHMSAIKVIHSLRDQGFELTAFESFTGGLLAPNKDIENPWEYKFTWNPRNVVLAGQGVVKFIQEGKYKYFPYTKLFRRTESIFIKGYGQFEGYGNRDSLKYLDIYGLRGIKTIYRGTLRRPGFCRTWDVFVQLGATDDSFQMEGVANMTHRDFINSFLSYNPHDSVELKLAYYLNLDLDGPEMTRLKWSGFFDEEPVGLTMGTPAQILEHILKKKWTLHENEHDMIVMWHKFNFLDKGIEKEIHSRFVVQGEDHLNTAMSKTVGIPMGIVAKLMLEDRLTIKGVRIPIYKEVYEPVLKELSEMNFDIEDSEPFVVK